MDPRLLDYYERELQFVREMGGEFAREFPKIAGRLGLDALEGADLTVCSRFSPPGCSSKWTRNFPVLPSTFWRWSIPIIYARCRPWLSCR